MHHDATRRENTVEIEGSDKPALIAHTLVMAMPQRLRTGGRIVDEQKQSFSADQCRADAPALESRQTIGATVLVNPRI